MFFYLLLYFLFKIPIKLLPDKQEICFPSLPFSFQSRYPWFPSATSMHFTWSPVKAAAKLGSSWAKWDKNTLPLSCQQAKEMLAAAFPHLLPTPPQPPKTWACSLEQLHRLRFYLSLTFCWNSLVPSKVTREIWMNISWVKVTKIGLWLTIKTGILYKRTNIHGS